MSVRDDCHGPCYAYIGDMAAYKQYLTSGFYTMVHGLAETYNWREIQVTTRLNDTTWD